MDTQYHKHLNSTFTRVNQVKSRITIKYANHAAKRHATNQNITVTSIALLELFLFLLDVVLQLQLD